MLLEICCNPLHLSLIPTPSPLAMQIDVAKRDASETFRPRIKQLENQLERVYEQLGITPIQSSVPRLTLTPSASSKSDTQQLQWSLTFDTLVTW